MSPNAKIIHDVLNNLPIEDRLAALLASIIASNPNGLAVSLRMISVTAKMSQGLSSQSRYRLAERLRDVADVLERSHAVRIDIT